MKIKIDETTKDHKDILFDVLKDKNVKTFSVSFDGGGDSGQIEDVDLDNKILDEVIEGASVSKGCVWDNETNKSVKKMSENATVREIIDTICYDVLEQTCGGWEINEGSYGTFTFDVSKRKVSLDFNERIIETNHTEYSF
jgi:hypothetical protein